MNLHYLNIKIMSLFNQQVQQITHACCEFRIDIFSLFSRKLQQVRLCISDQYPDFFEKSYKKICHSLMYILKFLHVNRQKTLTDQLRRCFRMLNAFLRSTQFEKFGHRFPLISYLANKFLRVLTQNENQDSTLIQKFASKVIWSQRNEILGMKQIMVQEIKFLKSNSIEKFFLDLLKDEVKIQNFQCVCCSQVFIKDWPINNSNPFIQSVVDLQAKNVNRLILERYFNSICNLGNGVLIVGAQKRDRNIYSVGVKFKNNEDILNAQKQISLALQNIRPKIFYLIQRIPVHSNFANEHQSYLDEHLRLCLRVIVFPSVPHFLTYIQYFKKGCESSYQIYKFDSSLNPVRVQAAQSYSRMHELYQRRKNFCQISAHKNIHCFHPYLQYSKAFNNQFKLKGLPQKVEGVEEDSNDYNTSKVFDDEPKFKYKNMSLIVTNSKKNDRYVLILQDNIKANKMHIEVAKPFQKSFSSNSGRSIWIVSHEPKFSEVKKYLEICEDERIIKEGALKIMPVTKKIFLEAEKMNQYQQEMLKNKFKERYGTSFIKEVEKSGSSGQTFQLNFNNYSQSIYAFMLLQEMQVRGRFMNDIHKQFCHY